MAAEAVACAKAPEERKPGPGWDWRSSHVAGEVDKWLLTEQECPQIPRAQCKARVIITEFEEVGLKLTKKGSSRKRMGSGSCFLSLARICTPNVNPGPGGR